tara:strand:- start:28877 stop:29650 length:774 start_codon:yes stop_codon:yes gene_type:complete
MKLIILAGGLGTRLSEETISKPKPMVEIGGKPIIWHLMKLYSSYDINEFIICCGYKGYLIKEYFSNYFLHNSDIEIDLNNNSLSYLNQNVEPWKITLVDTGEETMTGGRLLRVKEFLKEGETFCFTYGDGLSDLDINKLISFHKEHKKLATLTAVHAPGRFGSLNVENSQVKLFKEKPIGDGSRINGGFFVLSEKVIKFIEDDSTIWEREPLEKLSKEKELMAFNHDGFWHPMDTLRDKIFLNELWDSHNAPWKIWT